jgi:predicted site-specific integrase-resolvase
MNDTRSQLTKILDRDDWNILVVEHKDRLTRFGFNYIQTLLKKSGKTIEVVNLTDTDNHDIMSDLISIIYSFSARIYGKRKAKRKESIKQFLEDN